MSAEHRPKFAVQSPAMVTATRKLKNARVDINKQTNFSIVNIAIFYYGYDPQLTRNDAQELVLLMITF
jgi:hypothetical protein